jgi:hypothetical protein
MTNLSPKVASVVDSLRLTPKVKVRILKRKMFVLRDQLAVK